jgi:hypothetical protein
MDPVAAGLGSDVENRISLAGGAPIIDARLAGLGIALENPQRKRIDQRILCVAILKIDLSPDGGNAKAVAVKSDAADDAT